jgi:hypothetical protein
MNHPRLTIPHLPGRSPAWSPGVKTGDGLASFEDGLLLRVAQVGATKVLKGNEDTPLALNSSTHNSQIFVSKIVKFSSTLWPMLIHMRTLEIKPFEFTKRAGLTAGCPRQRTRVAMAVESCPATIPRERMTR